MRVESREIRLALIEALATVQEGCGRPMVEVTDDTIPTDDLPGFKSVNLVQVATKMKAKLGVKIPVKAMLKGPDGSFPSIGEIVRDLSRRQRSQSGGWHA